MRMDPPTKCLGTLQMSMTMRIQRERVSGPMAFLAGLQGAPDSVTVMKCGTRGAREVGLDCSNRTDLLLHIHRNGERNGEEWELELFRAQILKHELAGPGVTAKSAADELRTV